MIHALKQEIQQLQQALRSKLQELSEPEKLNIWQTAVLSENDGLEQEIRWEEHRIPISWPHRKEQRISRHRLELPASHLGISLAGSKITYEMRSETGLELRINDRTVYSAPYWAESQVIPVAVSDSFQAGDVFELVLRFKPDSFSLISSAAVRIEALSEWIFQLDTFVEELGFVVFLFENGDVLSDEWASKCLTIVQSFELSALEGNDWDRVGSMMADCRERLAFLKEKAKAYKVHLVGHAHIDMNWLWPWSETLDVLRRDFESMAGILEEFPEVRYSHSQAVTYQFIQEHEPELWQRVKKLIAAGQWEVTAATWVEGDLNMSGYETLTRQFLQASQYVKEHFGVQPLVAWEPDTFGHPASFPQIARKAGIRYYYFCRVKQEFPMFWWEGLDGSRLLAFNDRTGYSGRIFASRIIPVLQGKARQLGIKTDMFAYGIGDHGGGVTRQDVRRALRLKESPLLPQIVFSKAEDFFKEIEHSGVSLPVVRGEMNTLFEGCYTSHADIKKANRETEHALVRAEALTSMAQILGGRQASGTYEDDIRVRMKRAWQTQVFHQFHDILCGCAIPVTYEQAVPASKEAKKTADAIAREAMRHIVHNGDSSTLTVFNSLSWTRTDVVTLTAEHSPASASWRTGDLLEDDEGARIPLQRTKDAMVFVAENVPSFGSKRYRYIRGEGSPDQQTGLVGLTPSGNPILRGSRYSAEVEKTSGIIRSLADDRTQRQWANIPIQHFGEEGRSFHGQLNVLEVQYEAPHGMAAWVLGRITKTRRLIDGATVTIGEQGPVVQSVYVEHRVDASVIRQEIRVYRGIDRIDFVTEADWDGDLANSDAPSLRVYFTPRLNDPVFTRDIPLANVRRNADGEEVPAIHWIDLSEREEDGEARGGVTLFNDGKYGHSALGTRMATTLIRCRYDETDIRGDIGRHSFTYSLYPHDSDWREAGSVQKGLEIHQPLTAAEGSSDAVEQSALRLEECRESIWVEASGVIVTAFKPAEAAGDSGSVFTVRLVEMHGRPARIRMAAPAEILSVQEADLLEQPIHAKVLETGRQVDLGWIGAYEIRTLRVKLK